MLLGFRICLFLLVEFRVKVNYRSAVARTVRYRRFTSPTTLRYRTLPYDTVQVPYDAVPYRIGTVRFHNIHGCL